MAEHHNSDSQAGTAPEILIAAIAATTQRIRVGSAGVMLPHYSSLKVAEQFRVLEAIAPGRIDLGLGRAPGSDGLTALRAEPARPTPRPTISRPRCATCSPGRPASRWWRAIRSAACAPAGGADGAGGVDPRQLRLRRAGRGVFRPAVLLRAFHHRRPGRGRGDGAVSRASYRPSARHPRRTARCASGRWPAETEAEAERLFTLARDVAAGARPRRVRCRCPRRRRRLRATIRKRDARMSSGCASAAICGTADAGAERLRALAAALEVEEIAILTTVHDPAARRRSYTLLAEEFALA